MIGVAILGAGIGAQHLDGFHAAPGWDVRLIVDKDVDRARDLAQGTAVAEDIDTALADPAIDVIDICLPPHLHVPVALKALAAGKHVICEKPLATSLVDTENLRTAQNAAGKTVFPIFQYRFAPAFRALSALKSANLLGRPLVAAIETHWARGADYYEIPWRGTWAGEQGGVVLGHAIHAHDLLGNHLGKITQVSAMLTTRANEIETEDCAALSFTLDGGAVATSSITLGSATDETRLRFVFDRLTATSATNPYAPGQGDWSFTARDPADQPRIDAALAAVPVGLDGYGGAFEEIAKALEGKPNNAVTFADGATSVELVTAIYDAARSGAQVALPLPQNHPMRTGWQP